MRILLVEDDRALNRSLVKLLKTQNYSVDPRWMALLLSKNYAHKVMKFPFSC